MSKVVGVVPKVAEAVLGGCDEGGGCAEGA